MQVDTFGSLEAQFIPTAAMASRTSVQTAQKSCPFQQSHVRLLMYHYDASVEAPTASPSNLDSPVGSQITTETCLPDRTISGPW